MIGIIDDAPKIALVVFVALVTVTRIWSVIDGRSPAAAIVRRAWSGHGRRWITILVGLMVFAVVAEDVALRETDEAVVRLDHEILVMAKQAAPPVRNTARVVGRVTGEGLAVAVALAILGFLARGHSCRAAVVTVGTLGAWALNGMLKVAYGIRRPGWTPATLHPSDGFPSGHAFVTLVACLLIARALGHGQARRVQIVLRACAWAVAFLTAGARVVARAHWTSDVVAGLALGAAWAAAVAMVADFWEL